MNTCLFKYILFTKIKTNACVFFENLIFTLCKLTSLPVFDVEKVILLRIFPNKTDTNIFFFEEEEENHSSTIFFYEKFVVRIYWFQL